MNLAQFFGLDKIGDQSVQDAHTTINDALTRVSPILDNVFNRATILVHTVLNRFSVNIEIKLNPWNPPPPQSDEPPQAPS